MIVDCRTHVWSQVDQLGSGACEHLRRRSGQKQLTADPADHAIAAQCVDKSLVFGWRSAMLDADVPNGFVARYVAQNPGKLIGVAAVDPTEGVALDLAKDMLDQDEFRGLSVSPPNQGFHPADSRAMRLYELAARRGVPIFVDQGPDFPSPGRLEYARPALWDEVARDLPNLTLVIGSLGHPWVEECLVLLGKHDRVYADVAGLPNRPWQAYHALVLAHQFGVIHKVLLAGDFPFGTPAGAIEGLFRLNELTQGTLLPSVPREALRGVVERDALRELGIARATESVRAALSDSSGLPPGGAV